MTELLAPLSPYAPPSEEPSDYLLPVPDFDVAAYMPADALQQRQNDAVLHPVTVGTPVMFRGAFAFVVERNPNDDTRYELRWFDAHYHVFRQKWVSREKFEVVGTAAAQ